MTAVARAAERFDGFPEGGIDFFLELQAEQSRTWFKAHQDDFLRLWRRPLELFVTELQERLVDVYPVLAEVEPHIFRIQRDTRFTRDKAPYKTNVAAFVPLRVGSASSEDRHTQPGLYVSFGLEGEYVAVGAWMMTPEALQRYRQAIDDPKHGAEVQAMIDRLVADGFDLDSMETLKRVPPPYPQDHPRGELLKRKGLAVSARPPDDLSASPRLLDWAEERFRAAAPLVRWLEARV
jgi:uncharacterized protein (TIGR02453 family)